MTLRLRVVAYDDEGPWGNGRYVALDRRLEDRIIQEEVWSQTVWPEGEVPLASRLGKPDASKTDAAIPWAARFVVTRPSEALKLLSLVLRDHGFTVEEDPEVAASGIDPLTMETYATLRTTAFPSVVQLTAWALSLEQFVPKEMCGAWTPVT